MARRRRRSRKKDSGCAGFYYFLLPLSFTHGVTNAHLVDLAIVCPGKHFVGCVVEEQTPAIKQKTSQ